MALSFGRARALLAAAGLLVLASPAWAQAPIPPEAAAISACLCMERDIASLSQAMQSQQQALAQANRELADLNAQLEAARPHVDVNNPESVARYKALLQRRDAAYRRSVGPIVPATDAAVRRYNAVVNQYNAQCANHPFDSVLMAQIQQTLTCPPSP